VSSQQLQLPLRRRARVARVLFGTSVVALAVSGLSACSTAADPAAADIEAGPGPGNYAMDLGGYAGPEPTEDDITLTVMRQNWDTETDAVFDSVVADFEAAYPNISVEEEFVPYGDLSSTLQTRFAASNAPDIAMGRSDFVSAYLYGDMAVPIGDYFTDDFLSDYTPALIDSVTFDDTTYALPWEHQVQLFAYNKDIFAEAGIATPPETTDPADGWTLDQWMDANGHEDWYPLASSGFGNGGPGSNYAQLESTWIRMQGSADADPESDEYRSYVGVSDDGLSVDGYIDNPLAIEGMKNYQELFTNGWTPADYVPDMFKTGTAAVDVGTIYAGTDDFDWALTPLPRVESSVSSNASDSFIVTTQSAHPNEAAALLGALTAADAKVAWHAAWGSMPAQQQVIDGLPADVAGTERFELVANVAAETVGAPRTPGWFEYFNQMNTTVKDIALGADVESSLSSAVTAIDRALARYAQ
jgi:multiple sugar transport system substrate-binding protein